MDSTKVTTPHIHTMSAPDRMLLATLVLSVVPSTISSVGSEINLWPIPRQVSVSGTAWYALSENINISVVITPLHNDTPTRREQPNPATLIGRGALRYQSILRRQSSRAKNPGHPPPAGVAESVVVHLLGECLSLSLDTDSSYTLNVNGSAATTTVIVTANSCYGALHGLESLSQLSFEGILQAVKIEDRPMYRQVFSLPLSLSPSLSIFIFIYTSEVRCILCW